MLTGWSADGLPHMLKRTQTVKRTGLQAAAGTGGFSMVELVVVVAMVALLGLVAYPSHVATLLKARRSDAFTALAQAHQAQERWRAQNPTYAGLAELRLSSRSPLGHYQLEVQSPGAHAFELVAEAIGPQRADAPCRWLRVLHSAGETRYVSGPDEQTSNDDAANRRCWQR